MNPATSARITLLPVLALVSVACASPTAPVDDRAEDQVEAPEVADAAVDETEGVEAAVDEVEGEDAAGPDEATEGEHGVMVCGRGPTPITGSQSPLIVVDGVRTTHSLADISSLDVESIELVKGAAAAAEYGSAAMYGVVLITTKSGAHEHRAAEQVRR